MEDGKPIFPDTPLTGIYKSTGPRQPANQHAISECDFFWIYNNKLFIWSYCVQKKCQLLYINFLHRKLCIKGISHVRSCCYTEFQHGHDYTWHSACGRITAMLIFIVTSSLSLMQYCLLNQHSVINQHTQSCFLPYVA